MSKIKVVHYINQFFAQIGGEEKADYPAEIRVGEVVGPGLALTQNFKDEAEIIATVICGDSYFNENLEKAKSDILAMVKEQAPDVLLQDRHSMQDVMVWLVVQLRQLFRRNLEFLQLQVCM